MKKIITIITCMLLIPMSFSATWRNLNDDNYYSGTKLTDNDLVGKVVLVSCWGVNCGLCHAVIPNVEKLWQAYKTKPFMVLGSHCQGKRPEEVAKFIKDNKVTYPMYFHTGLADGEPDFRNLPFFYVVNHRGKIIYSGNSFQEATEAVVNGLGDASGDYCLTGSVILKKYKALNKQLVFGKNIKSITKKLEGDIKKAEGKRATAMLKVQAEEAKEILSAINEAKENIKLDYPILLKRDAAAAEKLKQNFKKTFSEDL